MKKALAPCRLVRQNILEPCDSRCILKPALAPPSAVGGQNVPKPGNSQKHIATRITSVFPNRKYFVRSTNSPCLQAEALPAKGEYMKKARGRKSPAGVYV